MRPIFYLTRFRFSRSCSARSTFDFGTLTSLRASASNAFQPLGFFGLVLSLLTSSTPLLGDSHKPGIINCGQCAVGKPLPYHLAKSLKKPVEIVHQPVVESERLLVRSGKRAKERGRYRFP